MSRITLSRDTTEAHGVVHVGIFLSKVIFLSSEWSASSASQMYNTVKYIEAWLVVTFVSPLSLQIFSRRMTEFKRYYSHNDFWCLE